MTRSPSFAYLDFVGLGAALYGVGAAAPFVRERLALSDTLTGLHSTLLASGLVMAGLFASRLDRRLSPGLVHLFALGLMAIGWLLLAWTPSLAGTLAAACAMGFGAGLVLGHANTLLGAEGGMRSRELLARANLASMSAAFVVPVVIGLSIAAGLGWQGILAPAFVVLALCVIGARSVTTPIPSIATTRRRLPAEYWRAWLFVTMAVAIEFTIVFWGATLVARRADLATADATLVAAAFLAGMVTGRFSLSLAAISAVDPHRLIAVGLCLAIVGAGLAWISSVSPASALGLYLAGSGIGVLYPLGTSLTLEASRGDVAAAGARLTIASGVAILTAPFVLGALSDAVGVERGWALVLVLAVAGLVLALLVKADARGRARGGEGLAPRSA